MKRIISIIGVLTLLASSGLVGTGCIPTTQPSLIETPDTQPAVTETPDTQVKTGMIEVRVTDAPGNVTAIEVTVSEVEVHKEVAGEGEWAPLTITGPNPFDLIKIRDKEQELITQDIDAARYTQIRMTVEMVEVTYSEDGDGEAKTVEATIPSGELKFVRPFDVIEGGTTTLIIDFDADKSVVFTGADKVIFKPVVKLAIERGEGEEEEEEEEELLGTIAGTVIDSSDELIEGATVVVEGTELSATTDGNGGYEIDDVPVGTYTVTASAEGYESASQENVEVSDDAISTVNFTLEPSA